MRLILCHCNGLINMPDLDFGHDVKIEWYDDLCKQEVKISPDEKVVVAGCSPSIMEGIFPDVDAEFINLKDHIFLMKHSLDKARTLIKAGIKKAKSGSGLKRKTFMIKSKSAAVIGAGVAGLDLTKALNSAGIKTYLIEKEPFLGGTVAKLDRLYPESTPWSHTVLPLISSVLKNKDIEIFTNSEITKIKGEIGDYKIQLKIKPRGVIDCNNCGACVSVCPVTVQDDGRIRKAIYTTNTYPNKYAIDFNNCNRCGECVKICPKKIDINEQDKVFEINAGAIAVATGLKFYDLEKVEEYGYGKFPNVMNVLEFERKITDGALVPKKVVFICCAGSRDNRHLPYCSRICCFLSLKEAKLVIDRYPDTRIFVCAMDMRSYGNFEYFYTTLRESGVTFIKGKPSEVMKRNGNLVVRVEDLYTNELLEIDADTVVLSGGFVPDIESFEKLGIKIDGNFPIFFESGKLGNIEMPRGIFVAGSAGFPAGVAETIIDSRKSAFSIINLLKKDVIESFQPNAYVNEDYCSVCKTCISTCPYNAITIENGKIKIRPDLCMGCGICASACPSAASRLEKFTSREISEWIKTATKPDDILALLCKWSAYNATETAAYLKIKYPENIKILRIPCSGAVEPHHIFEALNLGVKGILIGGCYPDACHYAKGNSKARTKEHILKETLNLLGISKDRVRLEWIGKDEAKKFENIIREMSLVIK
ncbi:MAG: hydrogenase iron-sulfur subunit [candidate division WOR-3 bacterium]|nr:hydrogenase iron-sulfur subunit [candidate division WOR-3 bacterium]